MTESNLRPEQPKDKRRYDPELLKKGLRCDLDQYEFLKQCSEKGKEGIKDWNKWRETNKKDIHLEGANFAHWHLNGSFFDENPVQKRHGKMYLRNAVFIDTKLRNARFFRAHLENADFHHASLEDAYLHRAHLEGADFSYSGLGGAQLPFSTVDGSTIFFQCEINRHTWFYCVGLDNAKIEPPIKQLLEYNIRRMNWENWYKYKNWKYKEDERHIIIQKLMWFIRFFWSFSDYGRSTGRIAAWFFGFAFVFAGVYCLFALKSPPGIVSNLLEGNEGLVPCWLVPFRAIYFSIITMTTLGFGDMYANAQSIWGHFLLTIQVILGYVLLGALVTRFAVLFTAGGPAGRFTDDKDKESKEKKVSE